jgi:hypothetical protein
MQLMPQALVVGLFTPTGLPGTDPVTVEKISRIWSELAPMHGYTQLQIAADGSAATFGGPSVDDGITIAPPLIQVRDSIRLTTDQSGDRAQQAIKTIARHLGARQFDRLGVKVVYHAATANNDAVGLVMHRILQKSDEDLASLKEGGSIWAGVKYVVTNGGVQFTLLIEPLLKDQRLLYLDLDAQFGGAVDLDRIREKANDADRYVTQTLNRYLDSVVAL